MDDKISSGAENNHSASIIPIGQVDEVFLRCGRGGHLGLFPSIGWVSLAVEIIVLLFFLFVFLMLPVVVHLTPRATSTTGSTISCR
jgi:hypothetical protein